ncbi:MAG TPA: Cof-type HAD-IIB family hydrolase [Caulobacteraceae bacterium]|jgi:hypothetical protein|nr:Cof-type HAD-IIB family hydrolase [Caulobacteraceae bacterium]
MTARPDIKLLLSDVDGTLVTKDKVLTEAAKAAVRDLDRVGIGFTVTSSRPAKGLCMLIEPLGLKLPVAGFNGGLIVNPDLSVVGSHPIDPVAARRTVDLLLDQGVDVWVYGEDQWFVRDASAPHVAREAWILRFDAAVVREFTDEHLARSFKIVGVSDDDGKMAAAEAAAEASLGEGVSATRSATYFLDVTHPMASKAKVVDALARHLNIAPAHVATIGDMPNDVLMFRESGFSVAMGNAADAVKRQASAVTDSNEDEGFAKAVRTLILSVPVTTREPR